MKQCWLLLLFAFILLACSDDKSDMPRLELAGVFLNGGDHDYSRKINDILPLSSGDYVDVSFTLDGNGTDLMTYIVDSDNTNVDAQISEYVKSEISEEFSGLPKRIGFKDGVKKTKVTVRLNVNKPKEEEVTVKFYLNSKAPDCEGAVYHLDLKTTTEPRIPDEDKKEERR